MPYTTTPNTHTRLLLFAFMMLGILIVNGCSTLSRNPVPVEATLNAQVAGMTGVRAWSGVIEPAFQNDIIESVKSEPPGMFSHTADGSRAYSSLAISGGGENGAFSAGFLNGWTKSGRRPTFKMVTGISTGALIAPFALLGPDYDKTLEKYFTGISAKDIYNQHSLLASIFGAESIADTKPLMRLIAVTIDETIFRKVAEAHNQGRRLYIGTTNLDADRLVIWNMGLIANSNHPKALELFRKVILASASIPIVFPPVLIEVEVDGGTYDEMHVDGGVKTQVFFHGAVMDLKSASIAAGVYTNRFKKTIYLIRNGRLGPEPRPITRSLKDIAGRSVATMIKTGATGDLYRISTLLQGDNVEFNFVGIPDNFEKISHEEFDPKEMKRLYDLGHELALSDNPWLTTLPGFSPRTEQ
jgi:hypothetical protein